MVVIGVPMYNFGIPSTLKSWLDQITINGKTFQYTENGPVGLIGSKKFYLAIFSGGIYSEGTMKPLDFTENYLRATLGFIGFHNVTAVRVEGVKIPGMMESELEKSIGSLFEFVV